MSFGSKLKELRTEAGLSQKEVAEKLGMARATYASLEVDRREPDLGEMRAVSQFYEVPMIELVAEEGDNWPGVISEPVVKYRISKLPQLPSVPAAASQLNPAKLRAVLLYTLGKIGSQPNVGEAMIYRLLYYIDTSYHQTHGQYITGLDYVHNSFGPTPTVAFVGLLKQMELAGELEIVSTKHFSNTQKKYLPTKLPNLSSLSARELQHIDQTLALLGDKTVTQLTEILRNG